MFVCVFELLAEFKALQLRVCFSGWRIRKKYFLIKNKELPKEQYLLSWVSRPKSTCLPH